MTESEPLYDRLGGQEAIKAVVDEFFSRVVEDDRLSHYFEGLDMDAHRRQFVAFICSLTGGPDTYAGNDMAEAHAHLNVTPEEFNAIAENLNDTLDELDVSEENTEALLNGVAQFQDGIVTED